MNHIDLKDMAGHVPTLMLVGMVAGTLDQWLERMTALGKVGLLLISAAISVTTIIATIRSDLDQLKSTVVAMDTARLACCADVRNHIDVLQALHMNSMPRSPLLPLLPMEK